MAALMRDWLGPMVEKELGTALAWKESQLPRTLPAIKEENREDVTKIKQETKDENTRNSATPDNLYYEDDGSNLRIKLNFTHREQSAVQIVHTESPTQEADVVRADADQAASLAALEDLSKHDAVTSKQIDISQSHSIGRSEHRNELREDAVSKKVSETKIPNSFLVHKWMLMEHTTRAVSRVSGDQQSLLNRPESWNRPEVGSHFPPANLPVAILQALNELADVAPELDASEKALDSDSESSSSVSDGETEKPPWSPTPPPNGLPPNSSSVQGQDSRPVAGENDSTKTQNTASATVISHGEMDAESDDDDHTSVNASPLPGATLAGSGISERAGLEDDSDIEVSVPRALDQPQRKALSRNAVVALTSSSGQTSTAFVSSESRLQVKETPHAAEGHSVRPTNRNTYSAQSSPHGLSSRTRSKNDDGETSSSNPVIPSTFAANTNEQSDSRAIEREDEVDKEKDRDGTDELMVAQQPQIGLANPLQSRVEASAESKTLRAKSPVSQAHMKVFRSSPMISTSPQTPRNDAKRPVTDNISGDSNKRVKLSRSSARSWTRSSPESIQDPRMIGRMARRDFMSRFNERGGAQPSSEDIGMSDVVEDDAAGRRAPHQHTRSTMNPDGHGGASMSVNIPDKEGHAYKAGATQAEEFVSPSCQPASRKMETRLVTEQSVFQSFLAAYPDYTGDATHFINRCRKINDLHKEERMHHPSLWDDYIPKIPLSAKRGGEERAQSRSKSSQPPTTAESRDMQTRLPSLTPDVVRMLADMPEPRRSSEWFKMCYEEDFNGEITQAKIWRAYKDIFDKQVSEQKPLLASTALIKQISHSFPRARTVKRENPDDPDGNALPDFAPRKRRKSEQDERWWEDANTPFKEFARAYSSLKIDNGKMGMPDTSRDLLRKIPRIDILAWQL
ncbi:hypothetical protein B0A49_10738 [Cryomyces minteri]|uniref:RFX-type winged-helix domain-containing protein n=1 Tax=Cryomyces minteri TaxID=331657 RepID=A0A4U0W5L8_9PEZI|nr:hypothetical protein B0A49_10738 [Cryomyces minteri]